MVKTRENPTVLDSAKKPAIILVHGFRGSPIGLQEIANILREHNYPVYIPPIPPFGGATKLPEYTPEAYSQYLTDYIHAHQLDRPVLIGHSMGSVITSAMSQLHPELVHKKSILLAPISSRAAAPFRAVAPLSALMPRRLVDFVTTTYLFVPKDLNLLHQTLKITHSCSNDHPPKHSEILQAAIFSSRYSVADFPSSKQQILILAGERDRLIRRRSTEKLAKDFQAQAEFLPNCGHLHNYEKPQETADKIIHFLES